MSEWKCLTDGEAAMVRGLGHDPGPMVVNRIGEGHWMFLDMKSRTELMVSHREDGTLRATLEVPEIRPPDRGARGNAVAGGAGGRPGGMFTMGISCI